LWSSVLVSSALSVFLRGRGHDHDVGAHGEGGHYLLAPNSDDEDVRSTDVTPHVVTPNAHDLKPSAVSSASKATCAHQDAPLVITTEAVASRSSGIDVASTSSGPAAFDGFSLVHRDAGNSFVEHVLSKGNSIDVWQGFLSFVGEVIFSPIVFILLSACSGGRFDPTDYLRQRGLDSNLPGFTMRSK
jgi:hypothetical protein